jgi:alginate O-acetyltransferase complex protein AlgI
LAVARTFCLICFAWIFFRANNVQDAFYVVGHLFQGLAAVPGQLTQVAFVKGFVMMGQDPQEFGLALLGIGILLCVHLLQRTHKLREKLNHQGTAVRWSFYYAAMALIFFYGAFNQTQQFIYFQF